MELRALAVALGEFLGVVAHVAILGRRGTWPILRRVREARDPRPAVIEVWIQVS
ncbi:hypothetical protein [Methylobacterium nodulans]|uniref:Uncharacterized protein n=1 Tax=Methylobacterium nodulans (strain LMG 21967 / CNCM I-2342 / ORS 2060) TaxID=460265 RepID=B8IPS7_METNO|nr:hypothetical protein [Methylobacterium nodulans]ACL56577.1 hypothetical protein Mnod_1587 [Methylobacterium nodulans ORS 2060]